MYLDSTRGNKYKLQKHSFHYNFQKFSFVARVVNVWNSLPDHVVDVNSLKQFETRLDKFWSNKDVMFDWTAKITGTGDRSEFNYKLFQKVLFKVVTEDTVIEALVPTTVSLLC